MSVLIFLWSFIIKFYKVIVSHCSLLFMMQMFISIDVFFHIDMAICFYHK